MVEKLRSRGVEKLGSRKLRTLLSSFGRELSGMLSVAKHLQYLPENKQMQIFRFAQDDSSEDFFRARTGSRLRMLFTTSA